jgi:Uma2 family endonuclease
MAATLVPPETSTESLPRKRFTREEVDQMLEAGLFAGQRYELIDGDLINKMGQGSRHAFGIRLCGKWLSRVFEPERIQVQLLMEAAEDERKLSLPEPDVAVLAEWKTEYQDRHPYGSEILLAIEVADTTTRFDLTRKAIMYARAGVREYWVLDLARRLLHVHRQPEGALYRQIHIYSEDDKVSMEGRSETVRMGDLLPSAPPASEPGNPQSPAS